MLPVRYGARVLLPLTLVMQAVYAEYGDNTNERGLDFISKWAAIGDSYASGIGSGNKLHSGCSRYDSAYPNLVNLKLDKDPKDIDFTFVACAGAKTNEITTQAERLSKDQQMITISAGGNDVGLIDALNDCVYTFKGFFSGNCDKTLDGIHSDIENQKFSDNVEKLIKAAQAKLAPDGVIYFTGYAKFFDDSTDVCDKVSWHIWISLFSRQYLTRNRRTRMNDLVVAVNKKLKDIIERAGDSVIFIDYDPYVETLSGRYCEPGEEEDKGKGANRELLFFYEMKTSDKPFLPPPPKGPKTELKRRDSETGLLDAEETTSGEIADWIAQTLQEHPDATLDSEAVNPELEHAVEEHKKLAKRQAPSSQDRRTRIPLRPRARHSLPPLFPQPSGFADVPAPQKVYGTKTSVSGKVVSQGTSVGETIRCHRISPTAGVSLPGSHPSANSGPVAHHHHVEPTMVSSGFALKASGSRDDDACIPEDDLAPFSNDSFSHSPVVQNKMKVAGWFVPDTVGRVFHPNQAGHSMIANFILYQLTARKAAKLNEPIPPQELIGVADACPMPLKPACNATTTQTWTGRDQSVSGILAFCADYLNTRGEAGTTATGTFNDPRSLDFMRASIAWDDDINISENQCNAWFNTVIDGCSVPTPNENRENWKHGGSIGFADNATLSIQPLVVRKLWDKPKMSNQQCTGLDNKHYVTHDPLRDSIIEYCAESARGTIGLSGTSFYKEYSQQTPDHVSLKTTWPQGDLNYQIFEEECNYHFSAIMDGCDIPTPFSNPSNWKHGGSMNDGNGIGYEIAPIPERAPAPDKPVGNCKSHYKLVLATFNVYGGGWASNDFGQSAGGLRAQIAGCGLIKGWKFEYFPTPHADGTEWHAWGSLPIGTRRCLGRAVASSGGFQNGCGGSG